MPAAAKLIPIVKIPDPILRQIAQPVDEITDGVRQLLDDMAATMYDAPGIGLAAPQINVSQRLMVIDCGKDDAPELFKICLLYTSPSPRDRQKSRMPSSA